MTRQSKRRSKRISKKSKRRSRKSKKLLSKKWETLEHQGVYFPDEYKPHNIGVLYKGKEIKLNAKQEEYATLYASMIDTDYNNRKIFRDNFWKDWKKVLGKNHKIKSLEECNFSKIKKHLDKKSQQKKELSKEQKQKIKLEKEKNSEKYRMAKVDGKKEPVENFNIEPPGLFRGRGSHPKMGRVKKRILPEDVTINIGRHAKIPVPNVKGSWKDVIHDKTKSWIATWIDTITGKNKYVFLSQKSTQRSQEDKDKYEIARKLKKIVKNIRTKTTQLLISKNKREKQLATALYFIDFLALRAGHDKGKGTSDTVGTLNLRMEHLKLHNNNMISLDFLGKDSIRYQNKLKVNDEVYDNLKSFEKTQGKLKKKDDEIFDLITTDDMNTYLQSFDLDVSAKVFRTLNASMILDKELNSIPSKVKTENDYVEYYNESVKKVALLCNHQKAISKNFKCQMDVLRDKIKELEKEKGKGIKQKIQKIKDKIKLKNSMKSVSLETSKTNYLDPRITIAFSKRHNIPLKRLFSKGLMERFKWADDVDKTYRF